MQLPFSTWHNPDKICDVMVGSLAISIEQLQEFQEASPEVGEQETSRVCEGECHWLYYPPNIFRMTCDQKCLAKHRYCQKSWFKNGDELSIIFVMEFAFLFWDHISSFNETCLVFVSLLFWNQRMFNISFWQNILIKLQHVIKINQSWRFNISYNHECLTTFTSISIIRIR